MSINGGEEISFKKNCMKEKIVVVCTRENCSGAGTWCIQKMHYMMHTKVKKCQVIQTEKNLDFYCCKKQKESLEWSYDADPHKVEVDKGPQRYNMWCDAVLN